MSDKTIFGHFAPVATENLFEAQMVSTIVQSLILEYKPKEDITAYELALAMPILCSHSSIMPDRYYSLPESVRRHFEIVK